MTNNTLEQELAAKELRDSLAVAFRTMRESAGLSQRQAAEYIGVAQQNISYMENGKVDVRVTTAQKIANGYGYHLEFIFEPYEEEEDGD